MRVPRASHYVTVPNATARDSRLTRRARGLLVELLSYPDGWETNSTALVEEGPEGRDAIRKALGELERLGYLLRVKLREADGRWATVSAVYDSPQAPGTLPPGVQFAPDDALEREPEEHVEAAEDQDGFSVLGVTSDDAASAQVSTATGNPTVGGPGAKSRTLSRTPLPPSQPGHLQSTPETGVAGARRRRTARGARGHSGPESKGPAPAAPSPSAPSCPEHPSQGAAACALCIAQRTTEPTETVNAVLAAARAAGAAGRARMAAAPRVPQTPTRAPRSTRERLVEPESAREAS